MITNELINPSSSSIIIHPSILAYPRRACANSRRGKYLHRITRAPHYRGRRRGGSGEWVQLREQERTRRGRRWKVVEKEERR